MQVEEKCGNYQNNKKNYNKFVENCDVENKCSNEAIAMNLNLERTLNDIAKKEGFVDYKIHVNNIAPDGGNFLGVLSEITIEGTTAKGNTKIHIFVKSTIPHKDSVESVDIDDLYSKEIYIYTELSRMYSKFEDEANVPLKERYNFVKCYKESSNEFIIMENMAKKGFGTCNRLGTISFEFAKKSIENLAKFHALSIVLQEKQPEYFDRNIKELKHPIKVGDEWDGIISNLYNTCLKYMDDSSLKKFQMCFPDPSSITDKLLEYILEPVTGLCLCHGDYRSNNILRRYVGTELEIVPVDYQFIHFGSPICDLIYLMFTATDGEFRRTHLNYFKNLYYDSMEGYLRYFGLNLDKFYPRDDYEREFKDKLDYGLVVAVWLLPMFLAADSDFIKDLGKTKMSDISFGSNSTVKQRFQEIVNDFIEWGYL